MMNYFIEPDNFMQKIYNQPIYNIRIQNRYYLGLTEKQVIYLREKLKNGNKHTTEHLIRKIKKFQQENRTMV